MAAAPIAATFCVLALGAGASMASFTPSQQGAMQAAVESWKRHVHYPGLEAGLWQPGTGRFETAIGVADRATDRPLRLHDRFQIGSITKTFTATLILQLVERGKLRLGDPVARYVGGIPHGRRITIRDLLNMTSGIHNYSPGFIQTLIDHPRRDWRPRRIVHHFTRKRRTCPARQIGKRACWKYSDPNYIILGQILRRVSELPLGVLFERRIFDPLGMNHTTFNRQDRHPRGPLAHGYIRDPRTGRLVDTTHGNLSWAWTAGGAISTLADLRRWGPALATGRGVLGPKMQRKRLDVVPIPHEHGDAYGLGILSLDGGQLLGHDGQPLGYDSFVLSAPTGGLTIAALGNTSSSQDPLRPSPLDSQAMEQLGGNLLEALAAP